MTNQRRVNVKKVFKAIDIDDKSTVNISKTIRDGENVACVDIRRFDLYAINNNYDGKKKATPHGVFLTLDHLPELIEALHDLYEEEFGKEYDKECS